MNDDEKFEVEYGSGNVFRDLGFADADVMQAKTTLASRIIRTLDKKKLSVRAAHKLTGFDAGDFSRIRNASLDRFSLERLISILSALDEKSEVRLRVHRRRKATDTGLHPSP